MPEKGELIDSLRHYMHNDGVEAMKFGQKDRGWGTLHLVQALFDDGKITRDDVMGLIKEARTLLGDAPQSNIYTGLKTNFPDAFEDQRS